MIFLIQKKNIREEYIQQNNVNFEIIFKAYNVIRVSTYIEYMQVFDVIDYNKLSQFCNQLYVFKIYKGIIIRKLEFKLR